MDREFEDALYLLQRAWVPYGVVTIRPVTELDHFYTDGTACGSVCVLLFSRPSGRRGELLFSQAYVFPNGSCWWAMPFAKAQEITEAWIKQVSHLFHPTVCRERVIERTQSFKEELVAAAWSTERVARWIEQGLELEHL